MLRRNQGKFIIAHRIEAVLDASHAIYMSGGVVKFSGTKEDFQSIKPELEKELEPEVSDCKLC